MLVSSLDVVFIEVVVLCTKQSYQRLLWSLPSNILWTDTRLVWFIFAVTSAVESLLVYCRTCAKQSSPDSLDC